MSDPSKKNPGIIASHLFDLTYFERMRSQNGWWNFTLSALRQVQPLRRAGLDLWSRVPAQFPMNIVCFPLPHFQGTTSVCIRPSCAASIERCILSGAVACGRWVRSVLCCVASVAYATSRALYPPTYASRTFCTRCSNQSFWWTTLLVFNSIHWLPWNSWVPAMCFCSAWVMKFNDTCSLQQWKQTI